jgi:hypothetical protein
MNKDVFDREAHYLLALLLAKSMHEKRLLTDEQLRKTDEFLRGKYKPILACLYPQGR